MARTLEREINNFVRRFVYNTVITNLRRDIDKYNQWKHFFLSLLILFGIDAIIFFALGLIFPTSLPSILPLTFIIFVVYWFCRINKLKKVGNTRNSKYWNDAQFWYSLNGWQFEQEVADVFEKNGYKTEVTKGSGDGGVDIIMKKNGVKYIVQCKRYNGHPATPQELRALWGVMDDFDADIAVMVATSGITDMGRAFVANKQNYEVLTLDDIIELSHNINLDNITLQSSKQSQNVSTSQSNNSILLGFIILLIIIFVILMVMYSLGYIK